MTGTLTYLTASRDTSAATLTRRVHYADPPINVPAADWEYVDERTIRLLPAGTPFAEGMLYELTYPARDPLVAGLGFAATRDLAAFLRHAREDERGNANPLAGDIEIVYTFGTSQPGRFMRDYIHLGFNEDGEGHRVFDGILNWVAGASGIFVNYRFAQPGRTHRQHIARWYPEREFPFANQTLFDPVRGKAAGRLDRAIATGTCPKIFEVNSANEYWVKTASLLHTDTLGNDLSDPEDVRFYFMSSLPHAPATGSGICAQPRNPLTAGPVLRALLVALDNWVTSGEEPPTSRVPRRADGTLVASLPQPEVGFPDIPGVTFSGVMTTGDLFDFGPQFDEGILSRVPPILVGSPYPAFVPRTDPDGNDTAGIRLPEVSVPLATYTGWALRAASLAGDDLGDAAGQQLDFARTKAERLAAGDPRLSIEERYPNHEAYVHAVAGAAANLEEEHFLLHEDVERYVRQATESDIAERALVGGAS